MSFEGYDALTEELTQNIHPQFLFNYLHNNIQNINDTFVPVIILLNDYCLAKNEVINELNVEMVNEIVVNILDDGVMNLKEEVIELVINILTFSNYEFITLYVHYEFIDRILDFLQDSDKFCENLYGLIESYLQKTDFQNIDDEKVSEFVMDTIPNFLNATISGSEIVSPRILQKFYPK